MSHENQIHEPNETNPLATSLALNLLIEPSTFSFTLKSHLHPIACLLGGRGTKSRVLFYSKASYSSCIAVDQSEFSRASLTVLGSKWARNSEGCRLGLWIPDLDLVCIGWVLVGIDVGAGTDSLWDLVFDDWGWIEVDSDEGWREIEEKPGGIEGTDGEWEEDTWEGWGVGATNGGDRSRSRLK